MIKRLTKHGNSLALILDRPVLELLNIQADTPLIITTDGKVLMITPVTMKNQRNKFQDASHAVLQQYDDLFKRLA